MVINTTEQIEEAKRNLTALKEQAKIAVADKKKQKAKEITDIQSANYQTLLKYIPEPIMPLLVVRTYILYEDSFRIDVPGHYPIHAIVNPKPGRVLQSPGWGIEPPAMPECQFRVLNGMNVTDLIDPKHIYDTLVEALTHAETPEEPKKSRWHFWC